jgi:type I restriction enzyme R subunit
LCDVAFFATFTIEKGGGSVSHNFDHLKALSPELHRLGTLAERFFAEDANTSLIKSRQFGEYMIKEIAALSGALQPDARETTFDLLRRLRVEQILPREIVDIFHAVRKSGNEATHDLGGTPAEALAGLKFCWTLGIWYRRTYGRDPRFTPGPFVPPKASRETDEATQRELERLRQQVRESEDRLQKLEASADDLAKARAAAEELARQAAEDSAVWEQTAIELEANQAALTRRLVELQAAAEEGPEQQLVAFKLAGSEAAGRVELDEQQTRLLIDVQLTEMGWEADSGLLRHSAGARPEDGRAMAIAEWPCEGGSVDYALFVGTTCIGVVEAKRGTVDVPATLIQAERYAKSIRLAQEQQPRDGPWQHGLDEPFRVPFVFATNGRPFVRQWLSKSGIWYRDVRRETNHSVALPQWFAPDDLVAKLGTDVDAAAKGLAEESFGRGKLRPYQEEAVAAIERAVEDGQREILISMATGTGKTRAAIALMYRLLKHKRFRRILFLVDRKALGKQAGDALETTEIEGLLNFAQIYKVAGLDKKVPEPEDQVQVATVQSLIARILNEPDVSQRPTPGTFDCIIVDEAHRGYTLDAELRESDIGFRNLDDYQSAYRQVLDYFDAVKIALTATPALHTREIFGHPVFHYGYRQAVVEGYLTDHLPPKRITTALSEAGIHFQGGEEVEIIDRKTGQIDLFELPDEVSLDYDLADFNRRVYSESFNRIVCRAIAAEIPPDRAGKTLIFAARDSHADDIVRLLREELKEEYGTDAVPHGMVAKITGAIDRPEDLILRFKNDPLPKYVVTVDLLTTGIDVPSICNLVFVRRVKSRILYDQMIGRATRLCPEISKEHFRIFDAVDLYTELQDMTDMRPVVVKPDISLSQLVADLGQAEDDEDRAWVAGQVIVRMRALAKRMDPETRESFERHTGETPEDAIQRLAARPGIELPAWLKAHPRAVELLERRPSGTIRANDGVVISTHEDELLRIEEIFGKNTTPEDYISGFERFVRDNMNQVPALIAVTQRPRDLTRKELSELAGLLDERNYSEAMLRAAYGKARNADIAAHIIGFVRQAALGDPLVPYATRVERAILAIEKSRPWTPKQKDWLRRIGRALKDKPVADPTLLDQGAFADKGGFKRISMEFDGALDDVLHQFNEAIWGSSAA